MWSLESRRLTLSIEKTTERLCRTSCSEKGVQIHLSYGFWLFINMPSEIDTLLLRMFSLCFQVAVWLEKQSSDLQLLSWRLGRGKSKLPKCIGYSEIGSTASHKSSNKLLVISVTVQLLESHFFWLMEVRDTWSVISQTAKFWLCLVISL